MRDADPYTGVRITVPARIDRARHPLRIDINVGDPVTPAPVQVSYPALLDEPFELVGYPLETVLAEKVVTMIDRGDTTTRDRDFADVYNLTGRHEVDAEQLAAALRATGTHRGSELRPLRSVLVDLATARQPDWTRFLARSGLDNAAPETLAEAIRAIAEFADPIVAGDVGSGVWARLHDGGVAVATADRQVCPLSALVVAVAEPCSTVLTADARISRRSPPTQMTGDRGRVAVTGSSASSPSGPCIAAVAGSALGDRRPSRRLGPGAPHFARHVRSARRRGRSARPSCAPLSGRNGDAELVEEGSGEGDAAGEARRIAGAQRVGGLGHV